MHQSTHQPLHQPSRRHPLAVLAMAAALLSLSGPAFAEEDREQAALEQPRRRLTANIVTRLDTLPEARPNWIQANIHTAGKHGFEFSRSFPTKDRESIVFSLRGPMIRKKTAGLTFEIRF